MPLFKVEQGQARRGNISVEANLEVVNLIQQDVVVTVKMVESRVIVTLRDVA